MRDYIPHRQSQSKDIYYIPYGGVYDYGDYHMSVYFKRTPATIDPYGNIICSSGLSDIKCTPEKYLHNEANFVGRNHMNKAFYMKLSVNDAARGFVVFPDVDRNIAKLNEYNCIYNLIKDNVVESIIGFIDHMESVIYRDDNGKEILCLPKILTKNKISGPQHISHFNELIYKIEQYYLINR